MVRRVPQRLPQRMPQSVQGLSVQGLNTAVLLAMTAAIQVAIQSVLVLYFVRLGPMLSSNGLVWVLYATLSCVLSSWANLVVV